MTNDVPGFELLHHFFCNHIKRQQHLIKYNIIKYILIPDWFTAAHMAFICNFYVPALKYNIRALVGHTQRLHRTGKLAGN